jgi:hypothetical protein
LIAVRDRRDAPSEHNVGVRLELKVGSMAAILLDIQCVMFAQSPQNGNSTLHD